MVIKLSSDASATSSQRRVRVVIQARMASARLPAKALLSIGRYPAIVLAALRVMGPGFDVVVATSTREEDDLIEHHCRANNVAVFRGSHDDVLQRFVQATACLDAEDICVRLTGDNVFPDYAFVRGLLKIREALNSPYVGYGTDDHSGLPYGLAGEAFLVKVLREADHLCRGAADREHVTTSAISKYRAAAQPLYPDSRAEYNGRRCTIDTYSDYQRVARVFMNCPDPVEAPWQRLCDSLCQDSKASSSVQAN